jgi:hypothetical protein
MLAENPGGVALFPDFETVFHDAMEGVMHKRNDLKVRVREGVRRPLD